MPTYQDIISPNYRVAVRHLVEAAGYTATPKQGAQALAGVTSEHFFPDEAIEAFVEQSPHLTPNTRHAVARIVQAGIFQDGGVEAYASPNAPLLLGLTELAAHQAKDDPNTCYVLGNADISNLGGLNRIVDRADADRFLAHLARLPEDTIHEWAAARGYTARLITIRTGGDEFRYVVQLRSDHAIDHARLNTELQELTNAVHWRADAFAVKTGIARIPHSKPGRGPGVGVAIALRQIDGAHPAIAGTLEELNGEIAATRKSRTYLSTSSEASDPMMLPPHEKPASHNGIAAAFNPYADITGFAPGEGESLEACAIRMALYTGGLEPMVYAPLDLVDLLHYDVNMRQTRLNEFSPLVKALSVDARQSADALIAAERMRGLVDPVTRCYSAAYKDDVTHYYSTQHCAATLDIDLQNLSGLNKVSEPFGDAMLREVGKILEKSYAKYFATDHQKPPVMRTGGGQFTVILPPRQRVQAVAGFRKEVELAVAALGRQSVGNFSRTHGNAVLGEADAKMLIADIPAGRTNTAPGINISCEPGTLYGRKEKTASVA